jgi:3'-phosphoadenosine 5'-phosphosulfate sulfotransferase (PAPS reductase)/FAD synthetase
LAGRDVRKIRHVAELIIGKQRHGPIGTVKLHFNEDLTKFSNLARESRFESAPAIASRPSRGRCSRAIRAGIRIEGPALISFSGGRTSAFMLHEILRAYDGQLPPDVVVAFANTGKEREETLRFVHECGSRWAVKVHWLEWRDDPASFEVVGFNSASRDGEPFAEMIRQKAAPPERRECATARPS